MLCLSNNTSFSAIFSRLRNRFRKLYRKKVYVHHYTEFIEESEFEKALQLNQNILGEYKDLEQADENEDETVYRYKELF